LLGLLRAWLRKARCLLVELAEFRGHLGTLLFDVDADQSRLSLALGDAEPLGSADSDPLGAAEAAALGSVEADPLGAAASEGPGAGLPEGDPLAEGSALGLLVSAAAEVSAACWSTLRNRSTAGWTSSRNCSGEVAPATLTTMLVSPSVTTSGSETPVASTRSAMISRARSRASSEGARPFA
jgi:hypothetical protein